MPASFLIPEFGFIRFSLISLNNNVHFVVNKQILAFFCIAYYTFTTNTTLYNISVLIQKHEQAYIFQVPKKTTPMCDFPYPSELKLLGRRFKYLEFIYSSRMSPTIITFYYATLQCTLNSCMLLLASVCNADERVQACGVQRGFFYQF